MSEVLMVPPRGHFHRLHSAASRYYTRLRSLPAGKKAE